LTRLATSAWVLATGSVFDPLYTALGYVLAWVYAGVPSYAVSIVLLTVAVRLVLYPLTVKQTKSMQAMQRLQPEIKRLQAKYKNDRQKLNEEMMKFYKENKVNPLAGCLPLLLQMPLFIVLYRLIHDLTVTVIAGAIVVGGVGSTPSLANAQVSHVKVDGSIKAGKLSGSISGDVVVSGTVVGRLSGDGVTDNAVHGAKPGQPATVVDAANHVVGTIDGARVEGAKVAAHPKHIPTSSKLYRELRKTPGKMISWGMDLAKRPSQGKGAEAIGLYLLVALTVLTGYYQQRQMTARTPEAAQNPQTQMMARIFPLFFGFISLQVPAGVVLYFVVSNLWQIGQQAIIFRQQDAAAPPKGGAKGGDGSKPAAPKPALPSTTAQAVPSENPKPNGEKRPPSRSASNRSRSRRRRRKGR
jgi:YidC/Oxa1 family membrane protein insertase